MRNKGIKNELEKLKEEMLGELYIEGRNVLDLYIRIAFADITDYVCFGNADKEDGTKSSYIYLKNWNEVDGQLIEEVTVNSGGGKIKLMDKAKALEKLEKFFDLFGADAWKRFADGQKQEISDNGRVINVITGIIREEENEV